MDTGKRREMIDWIRRQCFLHSDEKNGKCTSLIVSHVGSGKNAKVATIPIVDSVTPDDMDEIASEIIQAVTIDAEAIGGLQKYYIQAVFENLSEPINRFAFRLQGSSEDTVDTFDSEPANQKGLLGQLMRHSEASHRISVASTGHVIAMQNKIIARQAEQLETMQAKHIELIETLEELKSERHSRELDAAESMRKQEAYKDITQKILLLMPLVANKFAGQKLLPESTTTGEQMVKSLMDSIKPDQFREITEKLTPEQQMILMSIYENMRKFDEKPTTIETGKNGSNVQ